MPSEAKAEEAPAPTIELKIEQTDAVPLVKQEDSPIPSDMTYYPTLANDNFPMPVQEASVFQSATPEYIFSAMPAPDYIPAPTGMDTNDYFLPINNYWQTSGQFVDMQSSFNFSDGFYMGDEQQWTQ